MKTKHIILIIVLAAISFITKAKEPEKPAGPVINPLTALETEIDLS